MHFVVVVDVVILIREGLVCGVKREEYMVSREERKKKRGGKEEQADI